MVYIRTKKVKGENYLYLVQSKWDPKKRSSRQEIIKYLGNAEQVTHEDIPTDFRDDPKITAFLSGNIGKNVKKREELIKEVRKDVLDSLTKGDSEEIVKIYESYTKGTSVDDFLDNILKPVMYEIGDLWAANKLSVASEHIASNIAHELIKIISERISKIDSRGKILVCTPPGEEHNLGCNVLESFLQSKKFKVFNLSPSAPTESIISFIEDNKPDLVLVSITLKENIKAGQRFVKKISEKFDMPIMVGGFALENNKAKFFGTIVENHSLTKIYNLIRNQIS